MENLHDDEYRGKKKIDWRWTLVVVGCFIIAIFLFFMSLVLIFDPDWAYELVYTEPIKN